jgi:hypothetical protein
MARPLPMVVALAGAVLVAGCGPTGAAVGVRSYDCSNLPSGACDQVVETLTAGAPAPISNISVRCGVATCSRAGGGAGDAVITFTDGRTQRRTWSYAGDSSPLPVPSCTGLPFDACRTLVQSVADETAPAQRILAVTVTCTLPCSRTKGEATIVVTLEDGTQRTEHQGWDGGPP